MKERNAATGSTSRNDKHELLNKCGRNAAHEFAPSRDK
jgi:hypothetical protein